MGYSAVITSEPGSGPWVVTVRVTLSRAESSSLFLSGDAMVSWPVEGLEPSATGDPRLERSGMFVSEVAARPSGLDIRYREQAQAERTAALLRMQFAQIGIEQET
ncbi:MAG: hypothetical protein A2133_11120 [Actinobacteria bacterium RBG_16_64_13]|nr:MAG: hypothetical protein A2133_11120 [Actinobacteria bacterium RBG_16_64_13]